MKKEKLNFDVRITYEDGGFESFCADNVKDRYEAVIKTMTMLKAKERVTSVYNRLKSVTVTAASSNPKA